MSSLWPTLLTFIAAVLLLYAVQRWITKHLQGIGLLLFSHRNAGMALLWLVLLPGTIVHEGSHWIMAKLLGLKTGRFRIWPQFKSREVVLGSVQIQKSSAIADSLVGLAPFLGGSMALLAIGYLVFDATALAEAWQTGQWPRLLDLLVQMVQVPDSWLWLYLMVAISNAMMPSPSDRTSWQPVLIYLAVVTGLLLLLGWTPALPAAWVTPLVAGIRTLVYAFALTLLVDLVFAVVIGGVEFTLGALRGRRVEYK